MKLICIIIVVFALVIIICSLLLNRIMFQTVKTVNQQNCHEQYADKNSRISFKSGKNLLNGYIYGAENKAGIVIISHGMGVTSDYYIPEVYGWWNMDIWSWHLIIQRIGIIRDAFAEYRRQSMI